MQLENIQFRMFFRMYYNYLILFHWFQTIARNWRQKIVAFSFWFHNTIIFYRLENWLQFLKTWNGDNFLSSMLSPFWRSLLIYREFGNRIGIYRPAEAKLTIHFKGLTNFASPIMYLNGNGFHTSSQSFWN